MESKRDAAKALVWNVYPMIRTPTRCWKTGSHHYLSPIFRTSTLNNNAALLSTTWMPNAEIFADEPSPTSSRTKQGWSERRGWEGGRRKGGAVIIMPGGRLSRCLASPSRSPPNLGCRSRIGDEVLACVGGALGPRDVVSRLRPEGSGYSGPVLRTSVGRACVPIPVSWIGAVSATLLLEPLCGRHPPMNGGGEVNVTRSGRRDGRSSEQLADLAVVCAGVAWCAGRA